MILFIKHIMIFFTVALLYGCSGHALQDLIDGDSQKRSTDTRQEKIDDDKIVSPSENSALQSISPSKTNSADNEEHRYLQKSTNAWIENEWVPLTENSADDGNISNSDNKHISVETDSNTTADNDDNSSFTLQYYVDKAGVYLENRAKRDANKTKEPSHVDEVNAMPVIGTTKR